MDSFRAGTTAYQMIDSLRLIHAAGDQWMCNQSESIVMRAKEGIN